MTVGVDGTLIAVRALDRAAEEAVLRGVLLDIVYAGARPRRGRAGPGVRGGPYAADIPACPSRPPLSRADRSRRLLSAVGALNALENGARAEGRSARAGTCGPS